MSATALPLPLQLTKPVLLAGDLDTMFENSLGGAKYDPKSQVAWMCNGGGTQSRQSSKSFSGLLVIDVTVDIQVDDNDVDL